MDTNENVNVNIDLSNLPVIEKPVYIERYRTVYVNRPRVARVLDCPVLLAGFLWVHPKDLGNYSHHPSAIINNLNNFKSYGRTDWRIPTPDELALMEAHADEIGLGDNIYLSTDHANGVLRLVATQGDGYALAERLGGIYIDEHLIWAKKDIGASYSGQDGEEYVLVTIRPGADDARNVCPDGWFLASYREFKRLVESGKYDQLNLNVGSTYWLETWDPNTDKGYYYYKRSDGTIDYNIETIRGAWRQVRCVTRPSRWKE